MAEVLSQDEIDQLLQAISTGKNIEDTGVSAPKVDMPSAASSMPAPSSSFTSDRVKKIKPYDFKRPDKFSKDQIRTLQMIHESFARYATTTLSTMIRSMANMHVASVDQLTYEEFIKSLPNPTTLAVIDTSPLEGSAILEMEPVLVFAIIDRLFGSKRISETTVQERELTDIEMTVMEKVFLKLLNTLKDSWTNLVNLKPRLEKIESNPQFVQIVPPNDMIVLVTLETKIGDADGMSNLCIPYITLEPILNKLSAQYWYSSIKKTMTEENLERLKKRLTYTDVETAVEVGKTKLKFKDILNIKEGDVIKLDKSFKEPFTLKIANQEKFNCIPGKVGKKMGVKLLDPVETFSTSDIIQKILGGEQNE